MVPIYKKMHLKCSLKSATWNSYLTALLVLKALFMVAVYLSARVKLMQSTLPVLWRQ